MTIEDHTQVGPDLSLPATVEEATDQLRKYPLPRYVAPVRSLLSNLIDLAAADNLPEEHLEAYRTFLGEALQAEVARMERRPFTFNAEPHHALVKALRCHRHPAALLATNLLADMHTIAKTPKF